MAWAATLLASAFALPKLAAAAPFSSYMIVHWIHDKTSGQVAVDVGGKFPSSDDVMPLISKQFCGQYAADNTIDWDAFANAPLTVNVDPEGLGTISVGGNGYDTTACVAMYDDKVSLLECILPYSRPTAKGLHGGGSACMANLTSPLASLSPVKKMSIAARHLKKREGSDLSQRQPESQREPEPEVSQLSTSPVEARQVTPSCYYNKCTVPDYNTGSVDTDYHVQISTNLNCTDGGCSVGKTETTSQTVSFSVTADVVEWISAGFSVSESYSTGSTRTCQGTKNQEVCVWTVIPYKAYSVDNAECNTCGGDQNRSPARTMESPMDQDDAYCVRNSCQEPGDGYFVA